MCGISGIWNRDGRQVSSQALHDMNEVLAHRGPDGATVHSLGSVGFAFRRLAILDLSDDANQPAMLSERGLWLLFNGEIHNYREIRRELETSGHTFSSSGDTEVVLRAFAEWGCDSFPRFNGMWAIAVWNGQEGELVLARDRFGIKPLYYSCRGPRVAFASEAKAILEVFPEERVVDRSEVRYFLLGGSPDDAGSETFFANVKKVPAASYLKFKVRDLPAKCKYWDLKPSESVSSNTAEEELRFLLEDSVRMRLRSDVPLGVSLSGGLDSSVVTRLTARLRREPIHCFSLKYGDHPEIDESHFASAVADRQDRYRLHWVAPKPEDLMPLITKIVWHHDGPTPIRGRLAKWVLCKEASRWVTVVLVGEGGDELFAGYSRFVLPYVMDTAARKGWNHWLGFNRFRELLALYGGTTVNVPQALLQISLPLVRSYSLTFLHPTGFISKDFVSSRNELNPQRFFNTWLRKDVQNPCSSYLDKALWHDLSQVGLPETLHSDDALSMAFSLESRPPFLDHRLVEFCFALGHDEKIRDGLTKSILRRSMKGVVPPCVLSRRDKKGMPTPYVPILTATENVAALRGLLLEGELISNGFLDRKGMGRLLECLENPLRPLSTRVLSSIWRTATLEIWHRLFISRSRKSPG